jgi:hypothetical protein
MSDNESVDRVEREHFRRMQRLRQFEYARKRRLGRLLRADAPLDPAELRRIVAEARANAPSAKDEGSIES